MNCFDFKALINVSQLFSREESSGVARFWKGTSRMAGAPQPFHPFNPF